MERELRSACLYRNSDDFEAQNPGHFLRGPTSERITSGIGNNPNDWKADDGLRRRSTDDDEFQSFSRLPRQ